VALPALLRIEAALASPADQQRRGVLRIVVGSRLRLPALRQSPCGGRPHPLRTASTWWRRVLQERPREIIVTSPSVHFGATGMGALQTRNCTAMPAGRAQPGSGLDGCCSSPIRAATVPLSGPNTSPTRIRVYADQRCDPGGRAEASRSKGCARNVCAFDSIRYETLRLPRRINMLNISTLHECWIGWYRRV